MTTVRETAEPVQPGKFTSAQLEFGRIADVTRVFGIKRGTLYNLLRDGKVRGVLLRVRGQKSGVRLISMDSVRDHILSQMNGAETHAVEPATVATQVAA